MALTRVSPVALTASLTASAAASPPEVAAATAATAVSASTAVGGRAAWRSHSVLCTWVAPLFGARGSVCALGLFALLAVGAALGLAQMRAEEAPPDTF